jgi:hypothetical protein
MDIADKDRDLAQGPDKAAYLVPGATGQRRGQNDRSRGGSTHLIEQLRDARQAEHRVPEALDSAFGPEQVATIGLHEQHRSHPLHDLPVSHAPED